MLKKLLAPVYILTLTSLFSTYAFAQDAGFPPLQLPKTQQPITAQQPTMRPPATYTAPTATTTQTGYGYAPRLQPRAQMQPGPPQLMPLRPAPTAQVQANQNQKAFKEYSGYLGIFLDIIPSSVAAQLPKGISQGQGVLVKKFAANSPAETSDLKPFDVILAYNNKKIVHPAQFIKLVRNSQANQKVIIKVARKGHIIDVPVTLGSQKTPNPKDFNGLAIKLMSKNKYQAIVRYIGPNGNKQLRTYEGDREEIYQQALSAQDLPLEEREQLLYATRPRKGKANSFGSFFPFGGKNESGKNWMNPGRFFKF